jgi:predicted HNH restriction endonuclease
MARAELEELYRILMDARLDFIPRGELHLRRVYAIVKERYPELCDDSYLCSTNCKSGYKSPEWKHTVRSTLNELKQQGGPVSTCSARGMWVFGSLSGDSAELDEVTESSEGRTLLRLHKLKERKPNVVRRKKLEVLATTGCLACEACDFDFAKVYGSLGETFAECHHRTPLADLDGHTPTRLIDLAIVCSNCHRMLHRSRPLMKVEDLRSLVTQRRREGIHT